MQDKQPVSNQLAIINIRKKLSFFYMCVVTAFLGAGDP